MPIDPNYYAILGLKPGCSLEEVKNQYRRLAKIHHPDRNNNDAESQERIKRLNMAYQYLLDPAQKAAYDARFHFAPASYVYAGPPPAPRSLRSLRVVLSNGRSFAFSPHVLLGVVLVPGLIVFALFLGMGLSLVGGSDPHAVASSRFPLPADPEADLKITAPKVVAPPALPAPSKVSGNADVDAVTAPVPEAVDVVSLPDLSPPPNFAAPLRTRCADALPKVDALIERGDRAFGDGESLFGASAGADNQARQVRMARLEQDLSRAKTQRVLVEADIARLQWVQSRAELQQVSAPVQTDLRSLSAALKPVQADIHSLQAAAFHAAPAPRPAPVTVVHFYNAAPPAAAPPVPATKPPSTPHLSSPAPDDPQFSMPTTSLK